MSSSIQIRNLAFELADEQVPRYWMGGRKSVSAFMDGLSVFLPAGERFFMDTLNDHRDVPVAPELRAQVRAFCGQEGLHGREHVRNNDRLHAQDYPVQAMEERVVRLLGRVRRWVPRRIQLGVTCALEHFTATLARRILTESVYMQDSHPEMVALWMWHAAEECEHKSVAYDVFIAAGGTYPERIAAMLGTTVIFLFKVAEHQARMMHANGELGSAAAWRELADFIGSSPEGLRDGLRQYFHYYRPGFHPRDHDDRAVFDHWLKQANALRQNAASPPDDAEPQGADMSRRYARAYLAAAH